MALAWRARALAGPASKRAQNEHAGGCMLLRSTTAPALEVHAAARGKSCPFWPSHPLAARFRMGPSAQGPKRSNEGSTLPQTNAPAGRSIPAPWRPLNVDGAPPNDLHQSNFAKFRFPSRSQPRNRTAAAPEQPTGLHSDAQGQPERSPWPQSDHGRMTAAAMQAGLIRMRRLRAMRQRQ